MFCIMEVYFMDKVTVTYCLSYPVQQWHWEIFVREGKVLLTHRPLQLPSIEFTGKRFEKEVERLAEDLSKYGVTKKQLEEAILEGCKKEKIKPPKYLRS